MITAELSIKFVRIIAVMSLTASVETWVLENKPSYSHLEVAGKR